MKNEIGQERPFDKTKRFVREAVDDLYQGDLELPENLIDFDKPYTQIGDKFFQAEYPTLKMRAGDEIPLVSMPINEPPSKKIPSFKRRPNAALLYLFSDEKDENESFGTHPQIGNAYGVNREQIRQDVQNHTSSLHGLVTNGIKIEHPLNEICLTKPLGMNSRLRKSIVRGGATLQIREAVKAGRDTQDLKKEFGTQKVSLARMKLKNWGNDHVPERENRDFTEIIEKINNPNTSTKELKNLIIEFNHPEVVRRYGSKSNPVIINVSKIQSEIFGNMDSKLTKEIFEILKENQIPVNSITINQSLKNGKTRMHTYYITFNRTLDLARDVLKRYHEQYFHVGVAQINGEIQDEIPNTTQLFGTKKGEYVRIPKKAAERIMVSGSKVRIFRYESKSKKTAGYYVPVQELSSLILSS